MHNNDAVGWELWFCEARLHERQVRMACVVSSFEEYNVSLDGEKDADKVQDFCNIENLLRVVITAIDVRVITDAENSEKHNYAQPEWKSNNEKGKRHPINFACVTPGYLSGLLANP